jgi:glycosyltransferase involved in cell wall biosynthesis
LESIANQTLPSDEIIVVKDGMLPVELEDTLLSWQDRLPLKIVGYKENKGIIYALNYGLNYCSHELVARMDSDDICSINRFERQILFFEKNQDVVLLSGYINEFNEVPNDMSSIRKVPTGYENIIKYLKRRSAFNHVAVMFKKSAIFAVGGYQVKGFEDYDLWIRLIQAGFKADNLPEVLVYVRIGNNMISRRRGSRYVKNEIDFLRRLKKNSYISLVELIILLILRVPLRLLPSRILVLIYLKFLRKK